MPFTFDPTVTDALPAGQRCIEDRTANPVRGRPTKFRLAQQNMLAYTYPDFVPGFHTGGMNRHPFGDLIEQPIENARQEGQHLYPAQFAISSNQVAKVAGDVFQELEAVILWNAAARWNRYMTGDEWPTAPRYPRPSVGPSERRQVAVLNLPRRYDWVRLLTPDAKKVIATLRNDLGNHNLLLPTSTPDLMIVVLPEGLRGDDSFRRELPDLSLASQRISNSAYRLMEGKIEAGEIILAIALKKSLRSDRLYQPLYEANIMQLLLEGKLGAPQVDFEVHTLESAGTAAITTYRAASLGLVATGHAKPHRAVRELYEPPHADALVRRFLDFLNQRTALIPAS